MSSTPIEVAVFGSLNMDFVVRVPRAPEAGETLVGLALTNFCGGKGANQAVACARMGVRVGMIGCVGADDPGARLRAALAADDVGTAHVRVAGSTSGVAVILVDDAAENRIVIVPGANAEVGVDDADAAAALLRAAQVLVLQLEVPMAAVVRAATIAHAAGRQVVLNPAPARELPAALWSAVDTLVLNETEATTLTGDVVDDVASAMQAAVKLQGMGPATVVVTLGGDGAVLADLRAPRHFPAAKVDAVDTTAAGDTFIGAYVAALVRGSSRDAAVELAIRAAGLCVTRPGAQESIPRLHELG